jgi:hypothetical protein
MNLLQKSVARSLSKLDHLPFFRRLTPPLNMVPSSAEVAARKQGQDFAFSCAEVIASEIKPGWTEKETAKLIRTWLSDHKIHDYFHKPLVFFGERTRYQGLEKLSDLRPTEKTLQENDVYILDFGPVIDGFACDISVTKKIGEVPGFEEANALLFNIRDNLPDLVIKEKFSAASVWHQVQIDVRQHGYEPIHQTSEYSFFGHRLNGTTRFPLAKKIAKDGKQIYSEFFARGLSGQLWSQVHQGSLLGVWAVEPHIGTTTFGVKFEETLLVTPEKVRWLRD